MHQLDLVGGSHDDHPGQAGEKGNIEGAGVSRPVGTDQPCPVDGEAHRELLDGDVVHDLVIGTLQKGRIDRGERLIAFGGETSSKGHGMLLGDAHIETPLGESLGKAIEPGAGRHRRSDGDDLFVVTRFRNQRVGEDLGVARRRAGGLHLLRAGHHVELADAVEFVGRHFGGSVAFALLGDHMDQDRPVPHTAHIAQHGQQMIEVVAVDRADIIEAELLEQGAAGPEASGEFLGARSTLLPILGEQPLGSALEEAAEAAIGPARNQLGEIGAHGADRRGDRHVVVVENDDEARIHRAGIVHRLIGHARAHGTVADYGNHVIRLVVEIARHGHAETGRDRG